MVLLLSCLVLAAAVPKEASLDAVLAALQRSPAWRASFVQRYLPEGLEQGVSETGELTLAPPARLRFDYQGESPRTFASDGAVARLVDPLAGTCDAVHVDAATWGRIPLAVLLDPGAARGAFTIGVAGQTLRLVPRQRVPELSELLITVGDGGLPAAVVVLDAAGNRNEFRLQDWRPLAASAAELFRPSLPGGTPCLPVEE
ncbi:MAG: outer membrane lipoprotein carrier protein LolA [Acidobacteriota bacterium]